MFLMMMFVLWEWKLNKENILIETYFDSDKVLQLKIKIGQSRKIFKVIPRQWCQTNDLIYVISLNEVFSNFILENADACFMKIFRKLVEKSIKKEDSSCLYHIVK